MFIQTEESCRLPKEWNFYSETLKTQQQDFKMQKIRFKKNHS